MQNIRRTFYRTQKKAVETTTENTEKNVGNNAKKNREIVGNEGEKVRKSVGKKMGKRDEELENLEEKNRKKTGKIAENNQKNVDENSQQSGFGLNSDPLASSELYGISLVDFIPVKKPHRFSSESPLPNWYGKKGGMTENSESTKHREMTEKGETTKNGETTIQPGITKKRREEASRKQEEPSKTTETTTTRETSPQKRRRSSLFKIVGGKRQENRYSRDSKFNRNALTSVLDIPIEEDVFSLLNESMPHYWEELSKSLGAYATHAGHEMILASDVELFLKRCRLVDNRTSVEDLAHKNLPMELVEELVPIAKANKQKKER